jgi:hypothetical protein
MRFGIRGQIEFLAGLLVASGVAGAQSSVASSPCAVLRVNAADVVALSPDQRDLQLAELLGLARIRHNTIKPYALFDLDAALAGLDSSCGVVGRRVNGFSLSRVQLSGIFNSSQAYSEDDGVTWSGRGLTGTATAGFLARWNWFSVAVRPVGFLSQNREFDEPTTPTANFTSPIGAGEIDLPWRFGPRSYGRLDAGESWARVDTRWISAGVSSATQEWGPAHFYPLVLGPNAGGFAHAFGGTGSGWPVGIGTVQLRGSVGRLNESAYSVPHRGSDKRLGVSLVGSFVPAGLEGLEIGGGRFIHRRWPDQGLDLSVLRLPFEALLKDQLPNKDFSVADNQIASAWFRLARPKAGIEVYGEFVRDDHNLDLNDLFGEPDHASGYMLGLRRAWRSGEAVRAVTAEMVNGRLAEITRLRAEEPLYLHFQIVEGHTQRGQLLAAPAAFGGGGFAFSYSSFGKTGWWTGILRAERTGHNEEGGRLEGRTPGFHLLELRRGLRLRSSDLEAGAGVQLPWTRTDGETNLIVRFSYAWRSDPAGPAGSTGR